MTTQVSGTRWALVLLALTAPTVTSPVFAQYVATPPPSQSSAAAAPSAQTGELTVTPRNGQSQDQTWSDRYECHRWAKSQSNFDPSQNAANIPAEELGSKREQYRRALVACLEGRGYSVKFGEAAPVPSGTGPSPTRPPSLQPARATRGTPDATEYKTRPVRFQIEGGYTVSTGSTRHLLDDGSNVGFGMTWFPISSFPVGLRVDGSYSSFRARDGLLGSNFNAGHENVYGGDADLQLDLAHGMSNSKLYLFGGAGWYREQTHLRQFSWENGYLCDWWDNCWPGPMPVVTGYERSTSPWHSAWNAGLGWEIAFADDGSFFVEARFLRIAPRDSHTQFVPIRVGLRF